MNQYPAKLLLAGEFTVIQQGAALAIPLPSFYGHWTKDVVDDRLIKLIPYVQSLDFLASDKFAEDVFNGLQMKINFKMGYGMGSSGVLSAGILDRYSKTSLQDESIISIKNKLALIEHAFHGKSSGFDPLISFFNKPVFTKGDTLERIESTTFFDQHLTSLFLLDSMHERNGIRPIEWFYENSDKPEFKQQISKLDEYNEELIHLLFTANDLSSVWKKISTLQFKYFYPLITDSVKSTWQHGLASDEFYVKLCGKGSGGYYLIYVTNKTTSYFTDAGVHLIAIG